MEVIYSKNFIKQYKKQRAVQQYVDDRIELFAQDPYHQLLQNNALRGEYSGHRSINITGDYRAVYIENLAEVATFVALGTHSELYD